jgi:hypothetical protein
MLHRIELFAVNRVLLYPAAFGQVLGGLFYGNYYLCSGKLINYIKIHPSSKKPGFIDTRNLCEG